MVEIVTEDSEVKLMQYLTSIKENARGYTGIYFHLSRLSPAYQNQFQFKIALKIVSDILLNYEGGAFLCYNNDLVVIFDNARQELIDKIIFQLRYLFTDDQLAYKSRAIENNDFCTAYFLTFEFKQFLSECNDVIRSGATRIREKNNSPYKTQKSYFGDFIKALEERLNSLKVESILRRQIIAISSDIKKFNPFCEEVYISIGHLKQTLPEEGKIFQDRLYNSFLFDNLDNLVLNYIMNNINSFFNKAVSINLNVNTIFSDIFAEFVKLLSTDHKRLTVIEINIADIFQDIRGFVSARELLQQHGFRVCLDGVNNLAFMQIDRSSLGFDFLKLQWNADLVENLNSTENQLLKQQIAKCGANRIILCRCDDIKALEFGHSLGINIFQGWYLDKLNIS